MGDEREGDRITLGATWPTPIPYSSFRVDVAHTFAPGEDRDAAIDRITDDLTHIIEREVARLLAALAPEKQRPRP